MPVVTQRGARGGLLLVALALAAVGAAGVGAHVASPAPHAGAATKPNVVVILTDDQRWDTTWAMPNLRNLIAAKGTTFDNSFVVNAWCCPSRVAHLTGRYSHSSGMYTNLPPHGGAVTFRDGGGDRSTLATWLDGAGYRTGLFGKYLNGYNTTYVPPGWDQFVAFTGDPNFYDYTLNVNRTTVTHGAAAADYSTDVLADYAIDFVRDTPATQPLYLFFTPFAGHTPYTPAPRHIDAFSTEHLIRPPNFNEADVSDKPAWAQALPSLTTLTANRADRERLEAIRTLVSVDEAIAELVGALDDTGRLADTIFVYASDNGNSFGEHRWRSKEAPYEETIRVPLIIRYDALTAGGTNDNHLVLNIDVPVTIAELTGVTMPSHDGRSLVPLLATGEATRWRTDFLIEHLDAGFGTFQSDPVPTYCAVRSTNWLYVRYQNGDQELYDLMNDPYELTNLATDPNHQAKRRSLLNRLTQLCNPKPPGY